ncbi:replicative DNA helicase [bacterium]|nr:replicative DNA helicase [bacterium]
MADELLRNVPPNNMEAERAVLGALLQDPAMADLVGQEITPEHFYKQAHATIFQAMLDLRNQGQPADIVVLASELKRRGLLDAVGGPSELAELTGAVPTSANAVYYAKLVRDRALLRQALTTLAEAQREVFESRDRTEEILDRIEKRLFLVTQKRVRSEAADIGSVLKETFQRIERQQRGETLGIPYGYAKLDEMTQGLHKGELVVIAARPSMGKSTFALNVLRNVCVGRPGTKAGHGAVFFSLEMPKEQIAANILCSMARVDTHKLRGGYVGRDEEQQLYHVAEILGSQRIFIDDTPAITTMELRGKARRLKAEGKVDCIIIDYLQLMLGDFGSHMKQRHEVVGDISRTLKALARELEVPVVALAQLNRNVEDRPDHKPRMADLRESGAIEQDADVVMLLHRDEYYMSPEKAEAEGKNNVASIIVAKNRNGPTGELDLQYQKEFSLFRELEREYRR